jgi:glyoxylate/hydroxypyruvate reductase A
MPSSLIAPMVEQIDAFERGEPLVNLVDRKAGLLSRLKVCGNR